jgi:acetoin utilization deacetylase AcuC-like enzyme
MSENKKLAIITDDDFALKHIPPYPKPAFLSYENPFRIKVILEYLEKVKIFEDERIIQLEPKEIDEKILQLAHTKYYINTVKKLAKKGGGLLGDEVFITGDTYDLAKKAVGGAIKAVELVLNNKAQQALALIRPPGHHATRENASGLCIFNNIANAILYLRKMDYKKKIAIIDIDDHFGDGLCQYFYEDPSVLYASIHEFDFIDWDTGDVDELGEDEGEGTNINFPIPSGIADDDFLEFLDIVEPVLRQYEPDLIIIATGFDMYYDDPIGSCNLQSMAYYKFVKVILKLAEEICEGKLIFILEGGYNLIGLPVCVHAVINALLNKEYEKPEFEHMDFSNDALKQELRKIKEELKKALKPYFSL